MKTINIETIRFDDVAKSNECKNYPYSGLFMVKVANGTNDLRLVNKNDLYNNYVCPESIFNDVFELQEKPKTIEGLNQTAELVQESIKYEGDFILEFARILLNRKQL